MSFRDPLRHSLDAAAWYCSRIACLSLLSPDAAGRNLRQAIRRDIR